MITALIRWSLDNRFVVLCLALVLAGWGIVALVFGTKKIRGIGSDVGGWIRDFKKAMSDDSKQDTEDAPQEANRVIDAEAHTEKERV